MEDKMTNGTAHDDMDEHHDGIAHDAHADAPGNDGTSAHEMEASISADSSAREASGDTMEFARQNPPSFAPHNGDDDDTDSDDDDKTDADDGEGHESELEQREDGTAHPDHEDHDEQRRSVKRRRRLPWITIIIGALILCGTFGYLYANGNISGTPRAAAMTSCEQEAAKAREAKRLADMAITSAKQYIDDPKTTIDASDLRRLNILMDDAGKEPTIPTCTMTTRDNDLKAHAKTSKDLHDVYITIAKELLAITGGTIKGLDTATTDTDTQTPTQDETEEPVEAPTPTETVTATPTPTPSSTTDTAKPTPSPTSSSSSPSSASPSPSANVSKSPSASADAASSPSPSPSSHDASRK